MHTVTDESKKLVIEMIGKKHSVGYIAKFIGISVKTFYKYYRDELIGREHVIKKSKKLKIAPGLDDIFSRRDYFIKTKPVNYKSEVAKIDEVLLQRVNLTRSLMEFTDAREH
jgi:hypothetical protein